MAKGRKKQLADGSKNVIVKLEPQHLEKIQQYCQIHNLTISQVIRKSIENYSL